MIYQSQFKPAWWLSNPHMQTMAAKLFRRKETLTTVTETIELADGDFIDLAWTTLPSIDNVQPIVVVLHGLEGSKESHYAKGMLSKIKQQGWIGVLMHFRGCSGRPNRQGRSYHSGDIRDITYISELLKQRYQQCPFSIVGFSLGGNVLTQYLAQQPDNPYKSAVVVCAPLHLSSCSARINRGFSKVYQKYLVDMLKRSTKEKIALSMLDDICPEQLSDIKTIWEFDQLVTAPINGFNGAEDYYEQVSGCYVLNKIKQPCLIIHASDDPFLCHQQVVPKQTLPNSMIFEVCSHGGHVGFIAGNNPLKPQYWLEQRVPDFLMKNL